MSIHGSRSFGRGVVAVCAAGALLVSLLASPASAEFAPPENTNIKGILKGGHITLQQEDPEPDRVFPLGEKNGSSVKEKTEDSVCDPKYPKHPRSHFTAHVDGTSKVSNFGFHFAQGSTGEKFTEPFTNQVHEVCAQLVVKNTVQGQIDGKKVELDPGPAIDVHFIIKRKPQGTERWRCITNVDAGNHWGTFSEAKDPQKGKQQHDWNLEHAPKEQKFQVPGVAVTPDCPSLVAFLVNQGLGLPTLGEAEFKWAVYDCDAKDCSTLGGHPNKP